MEPLVYVETVGMTQEEAADHLHETLSGALALADGGRSYAVPVAHAFDGETLYVRLTDDGESEKIAFLEATEEATFVCYGEEGNESWSVVIRGALTEISPEQFDRTPFSTMRMFDEPLDEVRVRVFAFEEPRVTGRRTAGDDPWEVVLPRE